MLIRVLLQCAEEVVYRRTGDQLRRVCGAYGYQMQGGILEEGLHQDDIVQGDVVELDPLRHDDLSDEHSTAGEGDLHPALLGGLELKVQDESALVVQGPQVKVRLGLSAEVVRVYSVVEVIEVHLFIDLYCHLGAVNKGKHQFRDLAIVLHAVLSLAGELLKASVRLLPCVDGLKHLVLLEVLRQGDLVYPGKEAALH